MVLGFIEAFLNLNLLPNLDRRDPEKAQDLSFKKVQGNTGNRLVHLGYAGMEIVRIRVLDRRIEVVSLHSEGPRKFVPRNDPFEHKINPSKGHGPSSRSGGKPSKVQLPLKTLLAIKSSRYPEISVLALGQVVQAS